MFKALGGGPPLKDIHPVVLLVRETSRDGVHFAEEKEADLMIWQ